MQSQQPLYNLCTAFDERAQDHVTLFHVRKAEKPALGACLVIALGHVDQVECIWCIRCLIAISKLVGVGEDNVSAAHSFLQHAMLKVGHLREVGILLDVPARHGADSQATLVLMLQAWQDLGEGYDSEATCKSRREAEAHGETQKGCRKEQG